MVYYIGTRFKILEATQKVEMYFTANQEFATNGAKISINSGKTEYIPSFEIQSTTSKRFIVNLDERMVKILILEMNRYSPYLSTVQSIDYTKEVDPFYPQ